MMLVNNHTDSAELWDLRIAYRAESPDNVATPYRLGSFARRRGITISDFGAHSQRWIKKFNDGLEMRPQYKHQQQLKLFNP